MTMLKLSGVSRLGESGFILDNITFSQRRLQKIAIAGETGSGKSTLLKIIAGLENKDSGEVLFNTVPVTGPSDNLVPGHPSIRYLSQDFELPRSLRVEQVLDYSVTGSREEAGILYDVCRISHLLKRRTDHVSGGERQRIALARLLSTSPELLLLDEPFSNLDRIHKSVLKAVVDDIVSRLRTTVILISHDPEDILSWADTVVIMKDGKIVQKGTPEKVYSMPVNTYAAGLFGKFNVVDKRDVDLKRLSGSASRSIIRPEQLSIAGRSSRAVAGVVVRVNYLGSHDEVEVQCGNHLLIVRSETGACSVGKKVYISLSGSKTSRTR